MNEHTELMLRAIDAGLKGDVEALWVAKLLLTAPAGAVTDRPQASPTTRL